MLYPETIRQSRGPKPVRSSLEREWGIAEPADDELTS